MVDEFSSSAVDPAVLLLGGQFGGEVEQSGVVALVGDGFAAGADFGAGGASRIWVVAAWGSSLRSPNTMAGVVWPASASSWVAWARSVVASAVRL